MIPLYLAVTDKSKVYYILIFIYLFESKQPITSKSTMISTCQNTRTKLLTILKLLKTTFTHVLNDLIKQ